VIRWRGELEAGLAAIPGVHVYPSDANFVLVRTPNPAKQVEQDLLAQGVAIRNVSRVGLLEGCLRISVRTPEENRRCIAALRAALAAVD
jgi:histidinol-phosphate aminotransferase